MEMAKLSNEVESESERKRASTKLTSESTGKITSSCIPDRTQYFPNAKGFKKWRTSRKSSRCFLLELPSELRMCIWNYAIAGLRIALYQERGPDKERGRLTYGIVDKSSTRIPGRLVPVTYNAYHETIEKIHGIPQVYNRPPVLKQRRLTALLKTCRLIYSETLSLLYSGNVFVTLQNSTLGDFRASIPSENFAQIRSLHIHWEYVPPGPYHYLMELCFISLGTMPDIILTMPRLQQLSIFLQGPVSIRSDFRFLLDRLIDKTAEAEIPFFMIRVPWQMITSWDDWDDIDLLLRQLDGDRHVRLCRAPLEDGESFSTVYDEDCSGDKRWRVGSWFEPDGKIDAGFITTDYALFVPANLTHVIKSKVRTVPYNLYRKIRDWV